MGFKEDRKEGGSRRRVSIEGGMSGLRERERRQTGGMKEERPIDPQISPEDVKSMIDKIVPAARGCRGKRAS